MEKCGPQGVHRFYYLRQNAHFLLFPFSSTLFERNNVNIKRFMCVYVCMYVYMYVYIHTYIYICKETTLSSREASFVINSLFRGFNDKNIRKHR